MASLEQIRETDMQPKLVIPVVVIASLLGATPLAEAQVNSTAQPAVESAQAARIKSHHRERSVVRPGASTTGMNRDTPGARRNWYRGSP